MIKKEAFEQKTFICVTLWDSGSKEHIFPINVEGFLSAAKVRDMNA